MRFGAIEFDGKSYYVTRSLAVDIAMQQAGIDTKKPETFDDTVNMLRFLQACMVSGAKYAQSLGREVLPVPSVDDMALRIDPQDLVRLFSELMQQVTPARNVMAQPAKKKDDPQGEVSEE